MPVKNCCRNCHFLVAGPSEDQLDPWTEEDRGDFYPMSQLHSSIYSHSTLIAKCHENFWRHEYENPRLFSPRDKLRLRFEATKNRKLSCYFVELHENMNMEEARRLFKIRREVELKDKESNWTRNTSIAALSVSLLHLAWQILSSLLKSNSSPGS